MLSCIGPATENMYYLNVYPLKMSMGTSDLVTTKNIFQRNTHYFNLQFLILSFLLSASYCQVNVTRAARESGRNMNLDTDPRNIHAVIVSSSRYWFNYRHAINSLGMYEIYRQNGIPDENIILMIADEYAINARNPYKNRMHAEGIHRNGWYSNCTEIDYRGSDVTVQMFMDAILGEAPKSLKNLNADSNLMIYITGHGGDQFFKFQDEVRGALVLFRDKCHSLISDFLNTFGLGRIDGSRHCKING